MDLGGPQVKPFSLTLWPWKIKINVTVSDSRLHTMFLMPRKSSRCHQWLVFALLDHYLDPISQGLSCKVLLITSRWMYEAIQVITFQVDFVTLEGQGHKIIRSYTKWTKMCMCASALAWIIAFFCNMGFFKRQFFFVFLFEFLVGKTYYCLI